MPPPPYAYQGGEAIARIIARERGDRRGANLRLVPTRVTVGKKTLEDGAVDVRDRKTGEERRVAIAALSEAV